MYTDYRCSKQILADRMIEWITNRQSAICAQRIGQEPVLGHGKFWARKSVQE